MKGRISSDPKERRGSLAWRGSWLAMRWVGTVFLLLKGVERLRVVRRV
jgi:hypothetical protein